MEVRRNRVTGNDLQIDVWWTPDCGYLHLERNPKAIGFHCPDGVPHWSEDD